MSKVLSSFDIPITHIENGIFSVYSKQTIDFIDRFNRINIGDSDQMKMQIYFEKVGTSLHLDNSNGEFESLVKHASVGENGELVFKVASVVIDAKNDMAISIVTADNKIQDIYITRNHLTYKEQSQTHQIKIENSNIQLPKNFFDLVGNKTIDAKKLPYQMFDAARQIVSSRNIIESFVLPYKNKQIKMLQIINPTQNTVQRYIVNASKMVPFDATDVYGYVGEKDNFVGIVLGKGFGESSKAIGIKELNQEQYDKIVEFVERHSKEKVILLSKEEYEKQALIPRNIVRGFDLTKRGQQPQQMPKTKDIPTPIVAQMSKLQPQPEQNKTQVENVETPVEAEQDTAQVENIETPLETEQDTAQVENVETPVETEQDTTQVENVETPVETEQDTTQVENVETPVEAEQDTAQVENIETPVETEQDTTQVESVETPVETEQDKTQTIKDEFKKFDDVKREENIIKTETDDDENGNQGTSGQNYDNQTDKESESSPIDENKTPTDKKTNITPTTGIKTDPQNNKQKTAEEKNKVDESKQVDVDLTHLVKLLSVTLFLFGFFTGFGGLLLSIIALGLGGSGWSEKVLQKVGYKETKKLFGSKFNVGKKSNAKNEKDSIDAKVVSSDATLEIGNKVKQAIETLKVDNGYFNKVNENIKKAVEILDAKIQKTEVNYEQARLDLMHSSKALVLEEMLTFLKDKKAKIVKEHEEFSQMATSVQTEIQNALENEQKYMELVLETQKFTSNLDQKIEEAEKQKEDLQLKIALLSENDLSDNDKNALTPEEIEKFKEEKNSLEARLKTVTIQFENLNKEKVEKQKIDEQIKLVSCKHLNNQDLNQRIKAIREKTKQITDKIKSIGSEKLPKKNKKYYFEQNQTF